MFYLHCSDSDQTIRGLKGQLSSVSSYNSPVLEIRSEDREKVGGTGHHSAAAAVLMGKRTLKGSEVNLGSQEEPVSIENLSREYVWVSAEWLYTSSKILQD